MSFFNSELVQENLQSIFHTYQEIASKTSRLSSMNKEERIQHIEECKGLIDKQKTFYFRLQLAAKEDKEAEDMKNKINQLTQAFGYKSLMDCMDAMIVTLDNAEKGQLDTA
tara:strand:+ start:391 stop:723 length:333 start_codon:yes stop_codon:yes gene_type:complete